MSPEATRAIALIGDLIAQREARLLSGDFEGATHEERYVNYRVAVQVRKELHRHREAIVESFGKEADDDGLVDQEQTSTKRGRRE